MLVPVYLRRFYLQKWQWESKRKINTTALIPDMLLFDANSVECRQQRLQYVNMIIYGDPGAQLLRIKSWLSQSCWVTVGKLLNPVAQFLYLWNRHRVEMEDLIPRYETYIPLRVVKRINKLRHVRTFLALGENSKLLATVTITIIFVITTWLHIYTPGALSSGDAGTGF